MRATCDYCKSDFEVNKVGQRSETLEGEKLTIVFFTCSNCSKEYIASVTDSKIFEMREDLKRARETFSECDLLEESQEKRRAWKSMEHYKKKIIKYQDKLRNRYMKELKKRGY